MRFETFVRNITWQLNENFSVLPSRMLEISHFGGFTVIIIVAALQVCRFFFCWFYYQSRIEIYVYTNRLFLFAFYFIYYIIVFDEWLWYGMLIKNACKKCVIKIKYYVRRLIYGGGVIGWWSWSGSLLSIRALKWGILVGLQRR